MATTMTQIASEAEVSVSLVSRLLRGDDTLRTSTETRQRVLEVSKRLGGAKTLPGTQLNGLHVMVPFNRAAAGHTVMPITRRLDFVEFDRYLNKSGGQMNITFFDHSQRLETINKLIGQTDYCLGLLLCRGIAEKEIEKIFTKTPFPHVCIDPEADRYQLNTLFADERGGAMQAVNHFLALGHQRIGYMGTPKSSRYGIFEWSLKDERIELNLEDVLFLELPPGKEEDDHQAWRQAAKQSFIDQAQSPEGIECSALYCQNDAMALGVIDAMKQLGLTPGKDLSIIGNDDIESRGGMYNITTSGEPFLTTVYNPLEQVGQRAAEWLLEQHLGETKRITHERLPMKLIVRQTTGPAKKNKMQRAAHEDAQSRRAGIKRSEGAANYEHQEVALA